MNCLLNIGLMAAVLSALSATAFAFQTQDGSARHRQTCLCLASTNGGVDRSAAASSEVVSPLSDITRVAVTGATGRTGRFVVERLLSQGVSVLAMVRDEEKAKETFDPTNSLLTIRKVDLSSKEDVINALGQNNCDAAIWAATGFSDNPDQSFFTKIAAVFGFATNAQGSIDAIGLPALGEGLANTPKRSIDGAPLPKVVMLSSAGVTRPDWNQEKKSELEGCAGIPIVRLNPFGILGIKKESEEQLRSCGVEYAIFRPTGLNDNWGANQRPIFSQGDVAVGRINRVDVAKILVEILSTPEATGKTFEAFTIANSAENYYPPAESIGPALSGLSPDSEGVNEEVVRSTYAVLQQLLPGEKQTADQLAMGQTYEQLDADEEGRLGKKGEENLELVEMGPSSKASL